MIANSTSVAEVFSRIDHKFGEYSLSSPFLTPSSLFVLDNVMQIDMNVSLWY